MSPMSPRLLRPIASGFNPKSISGLAAWWDAADTSTVTTVSGAVSQWNDKSGLARNVLQSTANNRPAYSSTQNGMNVLTFDGSNDRLATSSMFSLGTGGYTVFAVASNAGGFQVLFEGNALNPYMSILASGSTGFRHYDGSAEVDTPSGVYTVDKFFVLEYVISSSSRLILVDGTQQASGAGTSRSAGLQTIGATTSGGFFWNGKIGEMLVYSGAVDSSKRATARSYLGKKWGVTVA